MSTEVPYPTYEHTNKFWGFMDTYDPVHKIRLYGYVATVLGVGTGIGWYQELSENPIDTKNDVYEAQMQKINELKATKSSLDEAHSELSPWASRATLSDLELQSDGYKEIIAEKTAQLPTEYHPHLDSAISYGGSIAMGLTVLWTSGRYFARKISESRMEKIDWNQYS